MHAMDALLVEHGKLLKRSNLSATIEDVGTAIDLLRRARVSIAADPSSASITLAKLQTPVKQTFDAINNDLREIHNGLGKYQKALDKHAKPIPLPASDYDALSSHPNLVNRAIAVHLLREGQFEVASTFMAEVAANPPQAVPTSGPPDRPLDGETLSSESLQEHFMHMYGILNELRSNKNLLPAIEWARSQRDVLQARGSNLEFELGRLQFVWLFGGSGAGHDVRGLSDALAYARREFGNFQGRYLREIKQLSGAIAYKSNLMESPYWHIFNTGAAWDEVARSFTREFCSILGLAADSPVYVAATAGAIALPNLLKLASIMKEKRTEWTTQNELPVEIPLPPFFQFHSIFVCPVSKEQCTEQNPPMMLPCCHVIAQESLKRLSKGTRFKCPYCPQESQPKDAKRVYL